MFVRNTLYFATLTFFILISSVDYNPETHKYNLFYKPNTMLITAHNTPSKELLLLCDLTHIVHNGSVKSIVDQTQLSQDEGGWLRKTGTERAELPYKESDKKIQAILHALGFIDPVYPSRKEYGYGIIFGSFASDLRRRLEFLNMLITCYGISCKKLIFLVSQRPRNREHEPDRAIYNTDQPVLNYPTPLTETDIARAIYTHTELSPLLRSIPVIFVDTPNKTMPNGTQVRANTLDTILEFSKYNLPAAPSLFISSQPHHHRQQLLAYKYMPADYGSETVACACKKDENTLNLLDAVARSLYEEYNFRKEIIFGNAKL